MSGNPDLGLLIFNRNDFPGVARLIDQLGGQAGEILVVDSSGRCLPRGSELTPPHPRVRWVWAFPLGCTEPLRSWAHREMDCEWILSIDTDETPTSSLLRLLARLGDADGYLLLRFERSLGAYSTVLRLYRRSKTVCGGWIHESPTVSGVVKRVPLPAALLHDADYRRYLKKPTRNGYLLIEAYERPFIPPQIRKEFPGKMARRLVGRDGMSISGLRASLLALAQTFWRSNEWNGVITNLRVGMYLGRYIWDRYRFFNALPPAERWEAERISRCLHKAGGVTPYLELDRPGYVERMTETFPWGWEGAHALVSLLRYRYRYGRVATDWAEARSTKIAS